MKSNRMIRALLLALALLLVSSPALAWSPQGINPNAWDDDFDIGDVVRLVNAEGEVAPDYVPATAHPGFYAARDSRNIDATTYSIVGSHQTFYWDALEPDEDDYEFWRIEQFVNAAVAAGKRASIGIITFNARQNEGLSDPAMHVPAWVFEAGATKVYCAPGQTGWAMFEIPEYWNAVYKAKYADFVDDLATYIESQPALRDNIEYVQIGVGKYGETQPSDSSDFPCVEAALAADGLDSDDWPSIVNAITQMYVNAFDTVRLLLPMAPRLGDERNRTVFTDYAIHNGVGLFPAGLTADQEWCDLRTKTGTPTWYGAGKYDRILDQAETGHPLITEPSVPAVPVSFEMYEYMTSTPHEFFWGAVAALSRRVDYISVERTALYYGTDPSQPKTDNIAIMRWATPYMGAHVNSASAAKAPSVFVALRESGMKSGTYSQFGNYSFGILQDDNVTNGRTVVVTYRDDEHLASAGIHRDHPDTWYDYINTNIETVLDDPSLAQLQNPNTSPDPDEPVDPYPSRKGWIARRTDQSTGNRFMYFKVDDAYLYGGSNEVTFTVHYFDRGTDQWRLEYDSATGGVYKVAGTVTKTNSLQWKVAKFTVTDAKLANSQPGASDFRIDCLNDGNEYLHMVDVKPGAAGTQTYQVNLTTANGGWNLVSVPLQPTSTAPVDFLASIAGKYDVVQAYQGNTWVSYPGSLTAITEKMGLWIHVTQNCTLTVSGQHPASTTIPLAVGWNLIGWPTTASRPVPTALAGIAGKYTVTYTYKAADIADPWKLYAPSAPSYVNDLATFEAGHGYWIYVTTATDLVVAY